MLTRLSVFRGPLSGAESAPGGNAPEHLSLPDHTIPGLRESSLPRLVTEPRPFIRGKPEDFARTLPGEDYEPLRAQPLRLFTGE